MAQNVFLPNFLLILSNLKNNYSKSFNSRKKQTLLWGEREEWRLSFNISLYIFVHTIEGGATNERKWISNETQKEN